MGLTSDKLNSYLTSKVEGTPNHYKNKLVSLLIYLGSSGIWSDKIDKIKKKPL